MKPVRILPEAVQELQETYSYYQALKAGLGREFKAEFESALARISQFPEAWPRFSKRTRRYILKRFPYSILYRELRYAISDYAVTHLKRRPGNQKIDS